MKAVILCAGYGKRMKPYTDTYQKTMIPVHGRPLLEYIIEGIKFAGIKDFILVVGYLKEQIIDYFQDRSKGWGINIEYVEQRELNGTGGALLMCEDLINEQHFFLSWGDTLVAYRIYKEVYNIFQNEHDDFIMVVNHVDDPFKGAAIYCKGNYCSDIIEKPAKGTSSTKFNNTGVYILSKEIFEVLRMQEPSIRGEIEVPEALRTGIKEGNWKFRTVKIKENVFCGDFGNLAEYERYNNDSNWLNLL